MFRLFSDVFGENNVEVNSYGNVKAATAYLYGLPAECLTKEELNYNDKQFPFIISAKVRKNVE